MITKRPRINGRFSATPITEKLESSVEIVNGCWEWRGTMYNTGYGSVFYKKKPHLAHRVSYEVYNGEIPEGFLVLHKCDNPPCINPAHLFTGTQVDNMADMDSKGRRINALTKTRRTHCKRGHEFTEENTYITSNAKRECRTCNKLRHQGKLEKNANNPS